MTHTVDLVPHLDAGDRTQWRGDQDERPLSALGRRQARALADALAAEPADALYSSPALRCRQSLEPLAERLGLRITVLPELSESQQEGWIQGATGGAHAAGRMLVALAQIRDAQPEGRTIACSHGDVIPALAAFLVGAHGLRGVAELKRRGQWYRVRFAEAGVSAELQEAPQGFPS